MYEGGNTYVLRYLEGEAWAGGALGGENLPSVKTLEGKNIWRVKILEGKRLEGKNLGE